MPHLRAILLMILAMAAFAASDAMIKLMSVRLPVGQIMMLTAAGSFLVFWGSLRRRGAPLLTKDALCVPMIARTLGELTGSAGFMLALSFSDLSVAGAILQTQPLIVTLAAALFLGERVGWRRISAISIGFIGVLLIIRPTASEFEPASLFAVLAAIGLSARDLGSRALPATVSTALAAAWALLALVALGVVMMQISGGWVAMSGEDVALVLATTAAVTIAFIAITEALRRAPVATISPFRYMRMVFVLALAYLVFDERPDALMWAGLALIIGSGLYAVMREKKLTETPVAPAKI